MRNFIRKSLCSLLILMVTLTLAQQNGTSFESAKHSKSAKLVYIHANVTGFASDNSGSTAGLLVEVMDEFEKFLNQKYGIVVSGDYVMAQDGDFKLYLEEVRMSSGGVFGLSNTSVKEERKQFLKFSPTFLHNISVLVSHENFPTLSRMDEIDIVFASKMGYGIPSTTNYERLLKLKKNYFPEMKITEVPNSIQENIAGDPNGFGFTDIHYYLEALAQGRPVKRHAVGDQQGDEFAIIMPKDSDWDGVFSEFLSGFIKTSKYREMVTKNLGKGALRMIIN